MKIIKCDTCDNAFYCETYFNEMRKKQRKLEILAMMCKQLGGYKKIRDIDTRVEEMCKNNPGIKDFEDFYRNIRED